MEISHKESRPAGRGPAETFTGEVSVTPLFDTNDARTFSSAKVSFTPCARTAWHTHPGGQTLIVTSGTGWVQEWGGEKQRIAEGRHLDPTRSQALARRHRGHRDDPHRHPNVRRRPPRRLARTRHRRAVPRLGVDADAHQTPAHGSNRPAVVVIGVVMLTATVACSTTTSPTTTSETSPAQSMSSPTSRQETAMPQSPTPSSTPIRIVIGDTVVTAELWDNAPAQALVDRLPLTLDFSDLNAVEKTARLDPALPMTGMPDGDDPAPRDIGWYAPSSDVVLYTVPSATGPASPASATSTTGSTPSPTKKATSPPPSS
jgi:hypothetical protein